MFLAVVVDLEKPVYNTSNFRVQGFEHAQTQVLWLGGIVRPGKFNQWKWESSDQAFDLYTNWKDGNSSEWKLDEERDWLLRK